jgi:hypothetical protein
MMGMSGRFTDGVGLSWEIDLRETSPLNTTIVSLLLLSMGSEWNIGAGKVHHAKRRRDYFSGQDSSRRGLEMAAAFSHRQMPSWRRTSCSWICSLMFSFRGKARTACTPR